MHCHNAAGTTGIFIPDAFVDLSRGKNSAGVFHQQFQNVIFAGSQADGFSVYSDDLCFIIQNDAADGQLRCFLCHAAQRGVAAQLRAYPCHYFDGVEGLGDVIICPHVQTKDFVCILAFCRQQDDRDVGSFPEFRRCGDAIHQGHHDIHQNQMDVIFCHHFQSLLPCVCGEDVVVFCGQVNGQGGNDVFFVVADQNVIHKSTSVMLLILWYQTGFKKPAGNCLRFL